MKSFTLALLFCATFLRSASLDLMAGSDAPHPDAVSFTLLLQEIRPLGTGIGHLHLRGRQTAEGWRWEAAADYNERSQNRVDVEEVSLEEGRLDLTATVTIGPDGARRGRAHFPTPHDVFKLEISATLADEFAEPTPDREAFMPVWRRDTRRYGGKAIRGTYRGTWTWQGDPVEVEGEVGGAWQLAARPGHWGAVGPAWVTGVEAGMQLTAFLPEVKAVEGVEAWMETQWAEPLSITGAGTLRLQAKGTSPGGPAGVSVQLRTERGWFTFVDLLPLTESGQEIEMDLARFGDRWRPFAGRELRQVRVGIRNAQGVGQAEMTLEGLSLTLREPVPEGPVTVVVRPESAWEFHGQGEVPKGLFGFHDVGENNPRAARPGEPDYEEMMRILNPGSLRPLTHTGFGGRPLSEEQIAERMDLERRLARPAPDSPFHRRARAGNATDLVIWTHTMDLWARPSWLERGVEAVARDVEVFYRNLAASAWIPGDDENVMRYLEVWNEPFMWGRHINMGFRLAPGDTEVNDDTQFGYIPGKVASDAWSEIFLAAARGARSVNPHVKLGGPSAPDFSSHDYADFVNHTLRILERVGDQLDFISEHHYGGNPLVIAAGYEVARSAMWRLHRRTVPIFNTEANDLGASDAGKATYNLTDILNLIRVNPDISLVRALHATWNGYLRNQGELHAYTLAAPVRGTMIDVHSSTPRLTVIASTPAEGELYVLGVDHGVGPAQIQLPLSPGFEVAEVKLLLTDSPLEELMIRDVDGAMVPRPAAGRTELVSIQPQIQGGFLYFQLPERSAFRVKWTREGYRPGRVRRQTLHPLPHLLEALAPGESLPLAPEAPLPEPDRLFLRLVHSGEVRLQVDGGEIPLPHGADRPSNALVQDIELPVTVLQQNPRLITPSRATVLSTSWITE